MTEPSAIPVIGILSIHGSVEEHAASIKRCGGTTKEVTAASLFQVIAT
jgi:glutamine amidotransferase PdxT